MNLNHIRSVGVELEGGINPSKLSRWESTSPLDTIHYNAGTDGSISRSPLRWGERMPMTHKFVELRMWTKYEDLPVLFNSVKRLYTAGFMANDSCGLHIHLKLNNTESLVNALTYEVAYNYFISKYKDRYAGNEKYLKRLGNHYCKALYNVEIFAAQLRNHSKCGDRYNAINLNAFRLYQTIEIRLMPFAGDFVEFVDELLFVIDTINDLCELSRPLITTKIGFENSNPVQKSLVDYELGVPINGNTLEIELPALEMR